MALEPLNTLLAATPQASLEPQSSCLPARPLAPPPRPPTLLTIASARRPVLQHHLAGLHSLPKAEGPQRTLHEQKHPRLHDLHL
jgi:hypothetical protein